MKENPKDYLIKIFVGSLIFSIMVAILISWILILEVLPSMGVGACFFFLLFFILLNIPNFNIKKIEKDIESDIFITGRRLLTLLESGESLIKALMDISRTKSKSSKYFAEIASEIYLGKSLESTLDHGIKLSPSKSFKRILGEIKNSLKTGSGISENLSATLDDIYNNKVVQIEEYGKKLNPLCMFYMIFGTIVPSIGLVLLILFFSLIQIRATLTLLAIILGFVLLIQLFFLTLFSKLRPVLGY